MKARTRSFLASAAVVLITAAVTVWLGHLAVEAQLRNAYDRAVTSP